jgi:hypothetical protein
MNTPYDRVAPHRLGNAISRQPQAVAPVTLESDSDGGVIMASFPATFRPLRMHNDQPRQNRCHVDFRWRTEDQGRYLLYPR